jgi:hypothetical protein
MRSSLRTLLPGQFGIATLLVLTAVAAIVFGVIRLPSALPEKLYAILALFLCLACWRRRNYLHPIQATIPYATRRNIAISDFFGTIFPWPPMLIVFYFWMGYRSNHPIWFSDVVFCGSLALLLAIATWKLVRALQPQTVWKNTIEV